MKPDVTYKNVFTTPSLGGCQYYIDDNYVAIQYPLSAVFNPYVTIESTIICGIKHDYNSLVSE
jgi:hypothetical protein